ncbi:MAG TPA: GyrI-like domain-containing protein [Egicoccus sp.]|nr:GyrI-like domain-containing protein [Egicoccus sp.]HSK23236.1 GyrI-like domain-containing protein [Egicoccus sp.]
MYEVETRQLQQHPTLVRHAKLEVDELGTWLGETYGLVMAQVDAAAVPTIGMPFARYRPLSEGVFEVEAGIGIAEDIDPGPELDVGTLPGGPAVVVSYVGTYDGIAAAYETAFEWLREHGHEPAGAPWEAYHTDPDVEPDQSRHRTEVVQPYR